MKKNLGDDCPAKKNLGDGWWNRSQSKTVVSSCEQPLENGRDTIRNAMIEGFDNFEITSNTDIEYSAAYEAAHHLLDNPSTACKSVSIYSPIVETIMQQIKEYVNTRGVCKIAGDKKTGIHSQNGNQQKNTVHSQYKTPRDMVDRYANVAKLLGSKDYSIRAVLMFVSKDDPKPTLASTSDKQMFLRHIDTDCLLTLFVALSNDE